MALLFGKRVFYHIPRTGGNYIRAIINGLRLKEAEINRPHSNAIDNIELTGLESFTIVRPPLDWYRSYYRLMKNKKKKKNYELGVHSFDDTFEQFVEKMLEYYPDGYVTARYIANVPYVTHVLRTEKLTEQAYDLFKSWGYKMQETEPVNVSDKNIDTQISEKLKEKLFKTEKDIIYYLEKLS